MHPFKILIERGKKFLLRKSNQSNELTGNNQPLGTFDPIFNTQSLKHYIEQQIAEENEGGRWEYVIHPAIQDAITGFNKEESNRLSSEILNWDENVLYELADAIIFGDNSYLEKEYLYCQIFLRITDEENLDYLAQNLFACYRHVNHETKPLVFYYEMKKKVKSVWKLGDDNNYFIKALDEMIYKKSQSDH